MHMFRKLTFSDPRKCGLTNLQLEDENFLTLGSERI